MSTANIVLDLLGAQLVDVTTLVPAEITLVHACIPSAFGTVLLSILFP